MSAARGPYPGSYYSVPLLVVLALVAVAASLAAVQVVRRPRGLAPTDHDDGALRKRSLTVIVSAAGVAFALSHAGVAAVSAGAMLGLDRCAPGWATPVGILLGVSAVAALVVGLWCLVRVVSDETPARS